MVKDIIASSCFLCEADNNEADLHIVCYTRPSGIETLERVCDFCFEEYYFKCDGCSHTKELCERSEIRELSTGRKSPFSDKKDESKVTFYCKKCVAEFTFTCESCRQKRYKPELAILKTFAVYPPHPLQKEIRACKYCLGNYYKKCKKCGSDSNTVGSRGVCALCAQFEVPVKPYAADPLAFYPFLGENSGSKTVYYGIELECNLIHNIHQPATIASITAKHINGFGICSFDRSIPNGFEIKTTPATFDYHKACWEPFFKFVETDKFFELRGKNCGTHIHVSKSALGENQIGAIAYFMNNGRNRKFMMAVAERHSQKYAQYLDCIDRPTNMAAAPLDHYCCLNTQKPHTIEFRIFASVLERESFFKNLEFVDCLVAFTKKIKDAHLLHYKDLISFAKENKERWGNFIAFYDRVIAPQLEDKPKAKPARSKVEKKMFKVEIEEEKIDWRALDYED